MIKYESQKVVFATFVGLLTIGLFLIKSTPHVYAQCDGDCETTTPTPTPTPTIDPCDGPCPTSTPEPTATPTDPCDDDQDICVTPTPTPTPEPTSNTNTGGGNDGGDGLGCATHDCSVHASTVQGKVLGASTMAKTGSFDQTLYQAIMTVGATLSAFGLKGLKKSRKVSKK